MVSEFLYRMWLWDCNLFEGEERMESLKFCFPRTKIIMNNQKNGSEGEHGGAG